MRKIVFFIFIVAMLISAIPAMAVSPAGERYINQIVGGGSASIRKASQSIYRTELTERAVLDVLAETVLQNYTNTDRVGVDSMAWACKALGSSGDIRYKNVLRKVIKGSGNRKLIKYAQKSITKMPAGKAKQPYKKGSINIASVRKKMSSGQSNESVQKQLPGKQNKKNKKSKYSLSIIKKGMSYQEVNDLIGEPTTSSTRLTNKTFNPFYYGSDTSRLTYLYKGKGRILFSRGSYSNVWRVMEVQLDSSEAGYP